VVREHGCTARHLWLAIENQFLGNHEQFTLHLDTVFRNFVQGDLSVSEYCHKFKAMADGLANLGSPVKDRILVLNILRGLNERFDHVGSIIQRYSLFPNFLKVRDDLLLEEIHMDSTGPSAATTALYTNVVPLAARPSSSTLSHLPSGDNSGNSGHRNKNNNKNCNGSHGGGNNSRNNNGSGGRTSSSGQPTVPTASDGGTGTPWPTYGHPWQGHMTIYPGPVPTGQQRLHAFMATSCPASSSRSNSRSTSRPPPLPHQAETLGSTWVGTNNRWPTPSTPWHSSHL
jgi:hypothetical protein